MGGSSAARADANRGRKAGRLASSSASRAIVRGTPVSARRSALTTDDQKMPGWLS